MSAAAKPRSLTLRILRSALRVYALSPPLLKGGAKGGSRAEAKAKAWVTGSKKGRVSPAFSLSLVVINAGWR